MATSKHPSAAQERVVATFVEARGDQPFRRQDLAAALYAHMRPRSLAAAKLLADVFIRRLQAANQLVKAGHVHWRLVVASERRLKSGRMVPDLPEVQQLTLATRCPHKWVSVDLETGEVWAGGKDGWVRATETVRCEAAAITSKAD